MTRRLFLLLTTLLTVGVIFFGWQVPQTTAKVPKILEFDTMVGVPQALTGSQNPIRGINGGGLPWKLSAASGELKTNGRLEIEVRGLVLAAGANNGSNPIANFRAIVSCPKSDGTTENITTGLFPATTGPASQGGGNADIEANVTLPQPCIAPLIFVTSPGGSWFATTGF
ncbi:MAG: hypothetical protein HY741_17550 [Chloroflexi bacterium]|nr:hypothetical protein [Chloroflexota bacterium]